MNTQPKRDVIFIATDDQLLDEHYYRRLWMAVRNLGFPRRAWLDLIANAIRDYQGKVLTYRGMRYNIPCIDSVFGDDPDVRWLSFYIKVDKSGRFPLIKTRKLERLRLIDLYFRIEHPQLADHFNR